MMRFRVGLGIGVAAGYVLGTRAGRERYEQIAQTTKRMWDSEQAAKVRSEVAGALPAAVNTAVEKVGRMRHHEGNGALMTAGTLPS